MSRRVRLWLFAAGAAVFAYLVSRIGLAALVANTRQTGWMFIPILLLYGVAYVCNAGAWALIMSTEPRRPPFSRVYVVTVAGFALNFVTPMVNVGGEPFRIAAVAPWLTTRRAAGSVIIHNVIRGLGFLLSWLTALGLGFVLLPHTPWIVAALAGATLVLAILTGVVFSGHRRGALEKILDLLHRLPLLNRLGRALEPRRELLAQMDDQIAQFYHQHPGRFAGAVALEYLSRAIYMGEYYLIGMSIGIPLDYARAYVIGGLSSLFQNLLFVVPFEVGSKEASLYLLFQMVGLDPHLGVYTAIVTRLRDLVWIGIGLLLVWFAGQRAIPPSPFSRDSRMTIVTHFLATTLGVQALGLEGRDKVLAYAFGMGVDVDHAVKAPFYLRAVGLKNKRDYYWRSSLQEPVALLWIIPLAFFFGTIVPVLFFAIHVAMDYSVRFEKMPLYPYSAYVTRGWLVNVPDKVKEGVLFTVLLAANIALYWTQHHV